MMAEPGTRVLYVTGWCRTGSTILGNLLGTLSGVVHVGELHYLWRNGVLRQGTNNTCGCGEPILECALWSKVLERIAPRDRHEVAVSAVNGQRNHLRTRHGPARLAEAAGRRRTPPGVIAALDRMTATYRAIAEETQARLIVDSSKYPAEAAALLARHELDLRILHLVRDPRATAHSWRQVKDYIPAMGVARSTCYWTAFNVASRRIGEAFPDRYRLLRYEDFAGHPHAALATVLDLAGLADPPPVDLAGQAVVGVNHTVTGNPDRLRRGPVRIQPDEAWRTELPAGAALLATVLASPELARYGYAFMKRRSTKARAWISA